MAGVANEREERFLRARGERAEQRQGAAKDDANARAREAFLQLVAERQAAMAAILGQPLELGTARLEPDEEVAARTKAAKKRAEVALVEWRRLQADIREANDTVRLTAHEVKTANAALNQAMADVSASVAAANPRTAFKFSARVATVAVTPADAAALTGCAAAATTVQDLGGAGSNGPESGANVFTGLDGGVVQAPRDLQALFVRKSTGATVLSLPVAGSLFVSDCTGCTVYAACHQLRIKNCVDCSFYVWARTGPVIEASDSLRFGPYEAWRGAVRGTTAAASADAASLDPSGLEALALAAGIPDTESARKAHRQVDDFSWLKKQMSPHWTVVAEGEEAVCDVPPQ